jgi:acyl-CoA thioester hydrolase
LRPQRVCKTQIRVRLSETDQKGVVYYSHYFIYFDVARSQLLKDAGINVRALEKRGLRLLAAEAGCKYLSAAKFDDLLQVELRITRLGTSSIAYAAEIKLAESGKPIVEGHFVNVMVNRSGRPIPIPPDIRKRLSEFIIRETALSDIRKKANSGL